VNNPRTVSDTKRSFYQIHSRPINSIYRRVIEELMVEMHLLSVNATFQYDAIYACGVVTAFDRFMQGYQPESDLTSIFNALCGAIGSDAQTYRQDAETLITEVQQLSGAELLKQLSQPETTSESTLLGQTLRRIASNPRFKYSRLSAIGLFTLLEATHADFLQIESERNHAFEQIAKALNLSADKLRKDLDLYRSNLDKVTKARQALEDTLRADRKQRERRATQQTANSNKESVATDLETPASAAPDTSESVDSAKPGS